MSSIHGGGHGITGSNSLDDCCVGNLDGNLGDLSRIDEQYSDCRDRGWSGSALWRDSPCTGRVPSLAEA